MIHVMRTEAKAAGKHVVTDVNHQDKQGKTPLFLAVEHKNLPMISLLYGLGGEGPDSLLANQHGWTVLHTAVNTNDLTVLKEIAPKNVTGARLKALLATKDKTGREPLHIAAYKCEEEVVKYLVDELGACNGSEDMSGNDASKLADRGGRRHSREIIDKGTALNNERRKSRERNSKELDVEGLVNQEKQRRKSRELPEPPPVTEPKA